MKMPFWTGAYNFKNLATSLTNTTSQNKIVYISFKRKNFLQNNLLCCCFKKLVLKKTNFLKIFITLNGVTFSTGFLSEVNPFYTEFSPVNTEFNPINTEFSPVITELNRINTQFSPVNTQINPINTEFNPFKKYLIQFTLNLIQLTLKLIHIIILYKKTINSVYHESKHIKIYLLQFTLQLRNKFSRHLGNYVSFNFPKEKFNFVLFKNFSFVRKRERDKKNMRENLRKEEMG